MIKHEAYLKCDLMLPSFGVVVQRLFDRKRRHVTSYYKYGSYGLFYVLFLLIYSPFSIQSSAIALAETTMSQIKASASDEYIKMSNEMDRMVTAVKLEDVDDEYFDDDQDDKEYKELLSNKSGKYNRNAVRCMCWCSVRFSRAKHLLFQFHSS